MNATIFDKLSPKDHGLEYCDLWPIDDEIDFKGCKECLEADHHTLANCLSFLTQLNHPPLTLLQSSQHFTQDASRDPCLE